MNLSKKFLGIILIVLGGITGYHWHMKHFITNNPAHELIIVVIVLFILGILFLFGRARVK